MIPTFFFASLTRPCDEILGRILTTIRTIRLLEKLILFIFDLFYRQIILLFAHIAHWTSIALIFKIQLFLLRPRHSNTCFICFMLCLLWPLLVIDLLWSLKRKLSVLCRRLLDSLDLNTTIIELSLFQLLTFTIFL